MQEVGGGGAPGRNDRMGPGRSRRGEETQKQTHARVGGGWGRQRGTEGKGGDGKGQQSRAAEYEEINTRGTREDEETTNTEERRRQMWVEEEGSKQTHTHTHTHKHKHASNKNARQMGGEGHGGRPVGEGKQRSGGGKSEASSHESKLEHKSPAAHRLSRANTHASTRKYAER